MPNVVGQDLAAAQVALQAAGIVIPSVYIWAVYPITVSWAKSALAPSTVLAQSPASGNSVSPNGPILLTCSEFPISVAYP